MPRPPGQSEAGRRLKPVTGICARRSFQEAEGDLAAAGIAAELRPIELAAFAAFTLWQDRLVDWPWPRMAAEWRRSWPERFELAIWSGDILCGLALVRPSRGPSHMSLYYIEGNPTRRTRCGEKWRRW